MSIKIIYTSIAELTFKDSAFLEIKVLDGANMNLKNTREHYEAIKTLTNNNNYMALVDVSNYFTIESEALRFASLPETIGKRLASAHYRSSIANSLTTKYFIANYKPPFPIKIFETKAEAIEWLRAIYNGLMATGSSIKK
jgi:hypothetical protein